MKWSIILVSAVIFTASAQEVDKKTTASGGEPAAVTLMDVKRIYVAPLTGGVAADQLRDLIIASLGAAKDFIITENENRADAVLKGAAEDKAFTDVFNYSSSTSERGSISAIGGGGYNRSSRSPSASLGNGGGEHESERDRVQKHEARAAVRLCNKDGDVIWSTTQESDGGKFHGASAEVALRVAKQLSLDLDRERKKALGVNAPAGGDPSDLPANARQIPTGPR
jgi:hypothetical protein